MSCRERGRPGLAPFTAGAGQAPDGGGAGGPARTRTASLERRAALEAEQAANSLGAHRKLRRSSRLMTRPEASDRGVVRHLVGRDHAKGDIQMATALDRSRRALANGVGVRAAA